jgi:hypothetical protein
MQDRASSEPKATSYDADDGSLSGLSEEEEQGANSGSVATKTAASSASKNKNKKRKTSPLMDDSAVAALTAGNKAMQERMQEVARHNKVVEEMEKRCFKLEENRLNLEQNRFQAMAWQGKNDELNYKMNLLARYEQFRKEFNWSDEQIVAYCPDMAQVIDARGPVPPTQHFTMTAPSQDGQEDEEDNHGVLGQQSYGGFEYD